MLNAGHQILRIITAFIIGPIVTLIAIGFNVPILISLFGGVVCFVMTLFIMKMSQRRGARKKFNLTKSEYNLIEEQLEEANDTARQLSSLFTKVRSIKGFRQLYDMNKIARRIINIVKTNPQKFYRVETFFYAHLPSIGELADKYVLLAREKMKDYEVKLALQETQLALDNYQKILNDDLKEVLADDIESLKMELDFAKMTSARHSKKSEPLSAHFTAIKQQSKQQEPEQEAFEKALQHYAEAEQKIELSKKESYEKQQDIPYKEPELMPIRRTSRVERRQQREMHK